MSNIITHRITTSKHTNILKKETIKNHFKTVQEIKNLFSQAIATSIHTIGLIPAKKEVISKSFIATLNTHPLKPKTVLTVWEEQKLLSMIMDFYVNRYTKYLSNKSFHLSDSFITTYYKRDKKSTNGTIIHKKGDVKSCEFTFKRSIFTSLLHYFKYASLQQPLSVVFNGKESEKAKENKLKLQSQLNSLKAKPKHYHHFLSILRLTQCKLNKLKPIEFSSGSHIKAALFNKNANVPKKEEQDNKDKKEKKLFKPTKHSYIFQDTTNTQFQWFYHFKTPSGSMDIPLSYNAKYHKGMEKYDLNKEHYVSFNLRGDVNIGLVTTKEDPLFKAQEKIVAMDLNVRDNFCVITDGKKFWNFDYQRKIILKLFKALKTIDERDKKKDGKTASLTEAETHLLKTLINKNVGMIKNLIAKILRKLHKEGVSDIVMEDLSLFETQSSYIKNKELAQKYTRLVRMLRLSQVKHWMKRNAENYGIRVHFIQAAYSSQECSHCHTIHKNNRKGDTYTCDKCGYSTHSDYNASLTLLGRFEANVLLELLHTKDEYGCYVSKPIKHTKIKQMVENYHHS